MAAKGQQYNVNQHSISYLLELIKAKQIAIPEIQRPFVWNSTKVRNLMDSLYQGYPIGYLIGWKNPDVRLKDGSFSNGKLILIDGQQRITAMMAALAGEQVVNKRYKKTRIQIAFHPLEERFEVANPAIRKNTAWIHDISIVFGEKGNLFNIVHDYCSKNPEADQSSVFAALSNLVNIQNHLIGFIELSHNLDIETVTEIFIRVNSAGVPLNQADFAMSKISVNESQGGNELRKSIDYMCRLFVEPSFHQVVAEDKPFASSPYFNAISWLKNENESLWDPSYIDVLRVAFISEFHRGRLADLVALLSGRNFETRQYEERIVEESFQKLKDGVLTFTSESRYKDLMMIIRSAGFVDAGMIGSSNALVFAYVLFHLLKKKKIFSGDIHKFVRQWFVMSLLTQRYSGSFETRFEQDARLIVNSTSPALAINQVFEGELSDSFWNVVLPGRLDSSSGNNQLFHIYKAAQIVAHDKGFLSSDMDVETLVTHKSDVHHLFPKNYLQKNGFVQAQYNQVANYVIAQTEINVAISNRPPNEYLSQVVQQVNGGEKKYGSITDPEQLQRNLEQNCVPESILTSGWQDYPAFLDERRRLMARKMRAYFEGLA